MSWPKNSLLGLLPLVVWYVERTAKAAAARISIRWSASYTYASCRLYVRTRFPITLRILSMIAFTYGFPGEAGLVLIPY